MAVNEAERIKNEIAQIQQAQQKAGPGVASDMYQGKIDALNAELAKTEAAAAAASASASGNTVTQDRVKGDTLGLGSQLVNTVGLNQDAYASKAYDPIRAKAMEQEQAADNRANKKITIDASTTKGAQIATGAQDQSRGMQMELGNDLLAASRGQGPSVAGMQYQRNMEDAMAAQMSMAASSRGNPAIAQRNAAANQAGISQRGALDSAMIRAQEQQQAQGALAGLSTNMRGQDQNLAIGQAGFDQQTGMFNASQTQTANTQGAQMTQANEQFYRTMEAQFIAAGMNADQAAITAKQRLSELGADLFVRQEGMKQGLEMGASNQASQFAGTIAGGVIGGVGSAVGAAIGKP